jgi:bacillithiol system protein YtxJ
VEHASPQVLLIKNGECIYHASHTVINAAEILEAAKS